MTLQKLGFCKVFPLPHQPFFFQNPSLFNTLCNPPFFLFQKPWEWGPCQGKTFFIHFFFVGFPLWGNRPGHSFLENVVVINATLMRSYEVFSNSSQKEKNLFIFFFVKMVWRTWGFESGFSSLKGNEPHQCAIACFVAISCNVIIFNLY